MGKVYAEINGTLAEWIRAQRLFFVATAPLSGDGLLNCSPKGLDTFAILGPRTVAYLDLTGSGVETIAHLRENGRIVIMFCALDGAPKIVRLHGTGVALEPGHPEFAALRHHFPDLPGVRSIIKVELARISDSCGFGVPLFDYKGERDALVRFAETKGPEGIAAYHAKHNRQSVEGLPGLAETLDPAPAAS
ncbi:MAG TPA: pyridoxamine 5'-phosphate oxidase family protein [Caldilineaceae bacterium]|nr:pyridoxamine 5'-phosphate oxidase family protein [Caldilineaceae bacterium]